MIFHSYVSIPECTLCVCVTFVNYSWRTHMYKHVHTTFENWWLFRYENQLGHENESYWTSIIIPRHSTGVYIYTHNQIYYIYIYSIHIYIQYTYIYISYPINRVHNLLIVDLSLSITLWLDVPGMVRSKVLQKWINDTDTDNIAKSWIIITTTI